MEAIRERHDGGLLLSANTGIKKQRSAGGANHCHRQEKTPVSPLWMFVLF